MRRARAPIAGGERRQALPGTILCLLLALAPYRAPAQLASAPLLMPSAVAFDAAGNLYIADKSRNQVFEATLAGQLVVVAGTGTQGFAGDGGPATSAELNAPQGLAVGANGTLYIADTGNRRIRAVIEGNISTFAGSGKTGYGGDGGAATAASFRSPTALAVDATGALLVCDTADHRIRRISVGLASTVAGDGVQGFGGDGGPATAAELDSPMGVTATADGRILIGDTHNDRIRAVATDGTISTFAGNGQHMSAGDGGAATAAALAGPRGLAFSATGPLLIAEADDDKVRGVNSGGTIVTVVGTGIEGAATDGISAQNAIFHGPWAVAVSPLGLPAIADSQNGTVWMVAGNDAIYRPAALAPGRLTTIQDLAAAAQVYGQVSAPIAVNGAAGAPAGTVTLSEGGSTVANVQLIGGVATVGLPGLGAGSHTLTAAYSGDGLNPATMTKAQTIVVSPLPATAVANAATVAYGAPLPTLTGTLSGVLPQDAGQVNAVFAAGPGATAVGSYPIAVTLAGPQSGNYIATLGTSSGSLQITPAATDVALANIGQGYAGIALELTATVSPSTSGRPTGTVTFLDGGSAVGSAAVVNGSASVAYPAPAAGIHSFTAQYSGDGNFQPGASVAQIAVVNMLPDFTLSASGSNTATVTAGAVANFPLNIGAQPGPFTGIVTLSATGAPPGAVVSFSPPRIVPGTASAGVTMSVQTSASEAALRWLPTGGKNSLGWALAGLVGLGSWAGARRRRAIWLLAGASFLCGCGARTVGEGTAGLPAQTYTLQVTGTATNLAGAIVTHSATLTLVVQP